MPAPIHTPFNGDFHVGAEIRRLVAIHKIQTIVETGMWSAHSTREFARMVPHVITIDPTDTHLVEEFGPNAVAELPPNVYFVQGDSATMLEGVLQRVREHPVLLFLDAHGGGFHGSNVNPIKEEFAAIAAVPACRDRCVIVIHDFYNPAHPDWGYTGGDWGKGWEPLSYEFCREHVERIYPRGHRHHCNDRPAGACTRGVGYFEPAA